MFSFLFVYFLHLKFLYFFIHWRVNSLLAWRLTLCQFFQTASILDESNDVMPSSSNTIKMENSASSYYCNTYPLSTVPTGIVSSVSDRSSASSMVVSSGYSML